MQGCLVRFQRIRNKRKRDKNNSRSAKMVQTEQVQSEMIMKMSSQGLELLKAIEEYRAIPYDDQTGKDIVNWVPGATVGYGHLIKGSEWPGFRGREVDEAEAEELFQADLSPFENCVMGAIDESYQLAEQEFDALVFLAYNIGQRGFTNSSVVKIVNDEYADTAYDSLEDAWMAWNKSQGKVMKGLENRRAAEWAIYCDGIYERW